MSSNNKQPLESLPREKNDSLGISGINQPDVSTGNLSYSDEASTSTPNIDRITDVNQTSYYVNKGNDENIGFLLECAKRGENRDNQRKPIICKVSRILRDHSESSFEPQLVSIGPIHREDPKLKEFECQKERYLDDLLHRFNSTPKETLVKAFLLKVNPLIPQIRESYAGVKKNYSDVDLARMMVMDGCFILEFCFKHQEADLNLPNKMQNLRIAIDLMLLENQVPIVVLQALFNCLAPYMRSITLNQVLDKYLAPYILLFYHPREEIPTTDVDIDEEIPTTDVDIDEEIPTTDVDKDEENPTTDVDSDEEISTTDVDTDSTHDHVLGYLHRRYQLLAAESSNREDQRIENTANHSIVELDRSGMNFEPHEEDEWSMTIKFRSSLLSCLSWFWVCCCCGCCCCCCCCCLFPRLLSWFCSKPALRMPTLLIDNITEVILRNFIAYEQSFPDQDRYHFTSYARAMDMLIDTQEDIAKLVESKVLVNRLGSNQEAADMINKICKNMHVTKFYYTQEFKEMDKYYSGCWRDHIAQLRRVYFSNPWSIITLLAAIILFSLTVVQTVFAIRAA